MSELTTGDINFGYQSPISQIYKDVEYKFKEDMENKIMEAVHHFGISVDKEELIKALQYDRNQYDKGYSDGRASIIEEFEKLKAEIKQQGSVHVKYRRTEDIDHLVDSIVYQCKDGFCNYIDNYIKELKGE